jgi:hypothetical protein
MVESIEFKKIGQNKAFLKVVLTKLDSTFTDVGGTLDEFRNCGFNVQLLSTDSAEITCEMWYKDALQTVEDIVVDQMFPETRDCSRFYKRRVSSS